MKSVLQLMIITVALESCEIRWAGELMIMRVFSLSADVLHLFDAECSGRRRCSIQIPNNELLKAQSCPKDLVSYLETDYTCVNGMFYVCAVMCCNNQVTNLAGATQGSPAIEI